MKKHPSSRQIRYAYGRMNADKTKQQCALEAGYSRSSARVPKLIENKVGYYLAMSQIFGELGNTAMQIMFEIKARGFKQMDNKNLVYALDVVSKNIERFAPKA